ncbi:hypothetical protein OnM2_082037 [Erysiphe neolycopersici]|uniref:Uncharacterized protein n=1 Tax=Erysiphe neolycopersici TaxID=212602 RepID=A0A420HFR9_9PEZI|nr:hypothetical protein OnM2_082037 [Erysiphe neolycopersici]
MMDSIPVELLRQILAWEIQMCRCEKNAIIRLRLVCHAFDVALKPYIFKTIQLECSRFIRSASTYKHDNRMDLGQLKGFGLFTEALYLDLMVIRDPEEIESFDNTFRGMINKLPEVAELSENFRRYCMGSIYFDERDFRFVLEEVLRWTPNMCRVRVNLPFQILGCKSQTATLLFATTLECLAKRNLEHQAIQTLVVDHLTDTALISICNNPMDLANAIKVFTSVLHLCISTKIEESGPDRQDAFGRYLWFVIRKARALISLCLVGWKIKKDIRSRRHDNGIRFEIWNTRSLPFSGSDSNWRFLRYLELKRVYFRPSKFIEFMKQIKTNLKELYLVEVYLRVHHFPNDEISGLWIGKANMNKPAESIWVAEELREMEGLKLNILRATGLEYDVFEIDSQSTDAEFDFLDPLELNRSFDQRFVDTVIQGPEKMHPNLYKDDNLHENLSSLSETIVFNGHINKDYTQHSILNNSLIEKFSSTPRELRDYDAETYQRSRNTTSNFKRCIDGFFFNQNEQALRELQAIVAVADRGMNLLSEEIYRTGYEDDEN